jgi:predicted Zn finger-like uncharacterized protein
MRITCPECDFSQEIREDKIPSSAVNARCPQCHARFKFRELPDAGENAPAAGAPMSTTDWTTQPIKEEFLSRPAAAPHVAADTDNERHSDRQSETAEEYAARRRAAAQAYQDASRTGTPTIEWEANLRTAPVSAFFKTLAQIIVRPKQFFSLVPYSEQLAAPIVFAIIMCIVRTVMLVLAMNNQMAAIMEHDPAAAEMVNQLQAIPTTLYVFVSVLVFFFENAIFTIVCHLSLRALSPQAANLRVTLRVVAYATAAWIASFIPQFGFTIGFVLFMILICMGLRAAHKVPLSTALASTLVGLFLFIVTAMVILSSSGIF